MKLYFAPVKNYFHFDNLWEKIKKIIFFYLENRGRRINQCNSIAGQCFLGRY